MNKIFLYGPPGSGKSTVGKILSRNLNIPFVDIDEEIEANTGKSIAQIIMESGEPAFRDCESDAIRRVCKADVPGSSQNRGMGVVALGGGALLRNENRSLCESSGEVVYLEIDFLSLLARLKQDDKQRPLLAGNMENKLSDLLEQRREHYDSFEFRVVNKSADWQDSGQTNYFFSKTPEQISWEIQQKLGRYYVLGMGAGYDVIVEAGGLDQLGTMLKERGLAGPICVVCDENVAKHYAKPVLHFLSEAGFVAQLLVIQPGEAMKTLETVAGLWRGFLAAGLDRKSTVVALGGGVVGDLAGFAASTYMRGCQWVVVPTTLLSMVDASLGGKTGFDLPEGKNLVGSFYPPRLVMADPQLLSTLSDDELRSGLAEVIKHGIIADPELFDFCSLGFDSVKTELVRIVRKAMGVKIKIIMQDPFEAGFRAALNLGHTVGHAVEIASNFQLRHGEAVAIGMVVEARLAEKLGLTETGIGIAERIKDVLAGIGLPTEVPAQMVLSTIIQAMKVDKKKELDMIKFALPLDIGRVQVGVGVAISDLEVVL